jgi:hypothetical protein
VPLPGGSAHQDWDVSGDYTCDHFSVSNPEEDGADDLPRLLRRVADLIEETGIQPMEMLDLTVSSGTVVGELIRRRMLSTLSSKGNWDDITDALGMAPDDAKARYPMPNERPNWGWGD